MTSHLFLFTIVTLAVLLPMMFSTMVKENFTSLLGDYPQSVDRQGVLDSYPLSGNKQVRDIESQDVWFQYPIFEVGSYEQITNNMKYQTNPDIGRCTRVEFCDTLYNDKQIQSNEVYPLPPVPHTHGKRIGYYRSPLNLLTYENSDNILY